MAKGVWKKAQRVRSVGEPSRVSIQKKRAGENPRAPAEQVKIRRSPPTEVFDVGRGPVPRQR